MKSAEKAFSVTGRSALSFSLTLHPPVATRRSALRFIRDGSNAPNPAMAGSAWSKCRSLLASDSGRAMTNPTPDRLQASSYKMSEKPGRTMGQEHLATERAAAVPTPPIIF